VSAENITLVFGIHASKTVRVFLTPQHSLDANVAALSHFLGEGTAM
jgi:hypothetical protein